MLDAEARRRRRRPLRRPKPVVPKKPSVAPAEPKPTAPAEAPKPPEAK